MKTILTLSLVLLLFGSTQAIAAQKIIRKNVRKVVRPEIAPNQAPTVATTEAPSLSPPPPPPPPTYEIQSQSENKGLFGWDLNTDFGGLYILNSGQSGFLGTLGLQANMLFADPWLIGSKIGLAEDALEYRLGLGLIFGAGKNDQPINSIPFFAEAKLYLKEGSFFGLDPFVGAGLNLNLYGTGQKFGGIGSQLHAGTLVDFGFPSGKTALTLGYQSIKVADIRTAEGLIFKVSQPLKL